MFSQGKDSERYRVIRLEAKTLNDVFRSPMEMGR